MIVRAVRYAGPSATARTLFGDLLRASDYDMLLNAADIPELLAALRTTGYRNVVPTDRKSFAFILQHRWIAQVEKVANLMPSAARELCRAYVAKLELEAVKTILRGIARGVERRHVLSMLPPLPTGSLIWVEDLLQANNLAQATRVLKNTAYAGALDEVIKPTNTGAPDSLLDSLLVVETAIEHRFFARLVGAARHVSRAERRTVSRLIGTFADVTNILAAARLKRTFRLTADAALTHLVPFGWHLGAVERRALSNWAGDGSPPVRLGVHVSGSGLRVALMRMLCGEAMKPLFAAPFQAGLPIAYLLVTEFEAADLVAIYEGKRWAFDRTAIANRLIRYYGSALTGTFGV